MDDKTGLPPYSAVSDPPTWRRRNYRRSKTLRWLGFSCLAFIAYAQWRQLGTNNPLHNPDSPPKTDELNIHGLSHRKLSEDIETCKKLWHKPQDPIGEGREKNARYIDGHAPTLIKNATVWVGEPVKGTSAEDARKGKGFSWINADVYLEYGLIQRVEKGISLSTVAEDTIVFEANGRPLTAGIIDMHSHAGVDSLPGLEGNDDTNEMSSDITPYVRSIDGLQPGDWQIQVIKSGGVTTSLVLPGSGNNMGGEAYVIKHAVGKEDGRNETGAWDMLADPDRAYRYMKMACGENAKRVYGKVGERGPVSRLGESWEFRHAFEQAAELVRKQDDWCTAATQHGAENLKEYLPQELRWESLGALLRGQVYLNVHCYTIPDLEAFVDHTNEFKFKVRAFHHAHQTFLVPEILKRAYGGDPPASAIFADNMWYKAEAYIGSEYAGKHLFDNNLTTIYVSDNPVLNAQHVVFEAAKGYKYGLPYAVALAAVTTAPAERLGLGKRLGKIKPGFDADVVVWDSDPLSVGAAPVQVWIDGTAQFKDPFELKKPTPKPIVPDESLSDIVEEPAEMESVIFMGITKVLLDEKPEGLAADDGKYNVVISKGQITCMGACHSELQVGAKAKLPMIALKNGYLTESFTAFGSQIGLNAIDAEDSTDNGPNTNVFSRAVDGLALGTKKLRAAHEYGVTKAITAPKFHGGITLHGTGVGFLTGATTSLEENAVFADDISVHYTLSTGVKHAQGTPSISSAVGAFRKKLLDAAGSLNTTAAAAADKYSETRYLHRVFNGSLPLVVTVHSADVIASLLKLKSEIDSLLKDKKIRLVIHGGAESYLLAKELAKAKVGVILAPLQSYAVEWEERRALSGAPLTNGTAITRLLDAGVKVAIGLEEDWLVRDLGLLAGIAYANGEGRLGEKEALDLVSGNVYDILGVGQEEMARVAAKAGHFVVYEGSPLEIGGRVKAVGGGPPGVKVFEKGL
ncbi:hypothetical protein V8F20_005967 [Naviculisporaceae sp. PSN 640]